MNKFLKPIGIVFALASSQLALAAPIVDTGQPNNTAGYSIFDYGGGSLQKVAARFSVGQTTRITGIELWVGTQPTNANQLDYTLHSDSASGPGAMIASERVNLPEFVIGGAFDPIWQGGFSSGATILDAGSYWVSFSSDLTNPNRCDCFLLGVAPNPIADGAYMNSFTGGNWSRRDMVFGLRIFGDPAGGAVPEPDNWALLIAGFGLIGGTMRLRRRQMQFAWNDLR